MRIQFPDADRPKAIAKCLVRLFPHLKLSATQEALARAAGHRDWHELSTSPQLRRETLHQVGKREAAVQVTVSLADALGGIPDGDVQFALTKARLFWNDSWSLEDQIAVRTTILRKRVFGSPARGKPGTVVRLKVSGRSDEPAYLQHAGRASRVICDTGFATVADFEIITPRAPLADFLPARLWLPYGYWTLGDGSKVIFARDYLPMWRIALGAVERLEPWYWITGITSRFNFAESLGTTQWAGRRARDQALDYLAEHRIAGLPRLVNVMPYLFEPEVENIYDGIRQNYKNLHGERPLPTYARLNKSLIDG